MDDPIRDFDEQLRAAGFDFGIRGAGKQNEVFTPPPLISVGKVPSRYAPGFLEKVKNFATATAGHVAAGMPMASDEEIIRRHDICLDCEHLQNNACTQCGCPVSRVRGYVSKLSWADSECPIGKWGKTTKNSIDP